MARCSGSVPPVPDARIMNRSIYGLVKVRTNGERLRFAVRSEGSHSWAYETFEPDEIAIAVTMVPDDS